MRSAIVIPGHGALGRDGVYRISARCLRLVREAERRAWELAPDAVVFSGWSPNGGLSEAAEMRAAWRGPDVELVEEPTARFTAENAARTLPLLVDRRIARAVIVCAPLHVVRARFFFRRLYEAHGIQAEFAVAPVPPTPAAIAWELAALPACRRQLRSARAELARSR
jgi:uncharacterized SAM-binding protein YcdF (DUF218 family)